MTTTAPARTTPAELEAALRDVPDPEVPVLSVGDLGILRSVVADEATGCATVTVTPTYSGCPATEAIASHLAHVARRSGWQVDVVTRLDPPWTTDWMSDAGRERLRRFGIAPPGPAAHRDGRAPVELHLTRRVVTCPHCGSDDTEELSRFGSTACKALRRCRSCREPFDEFKAI